ncbi:hypothetical protein Cgig2_033488 [Carnegiea gigantea]|uniref:Protein FAR1-RELATED SEQUENCE n=1 Tax=Carnegiea gigantea TaxID=171969 RepID=A0A9Q1GNT3_9CARY|nr:hypothetical protein Cgig2_033488 [Carnegiea gigantea]
MESPRCECNAHMRITLRRALRKPPKTIITDQDLWICEAIASEMPTTKHNYCIQHITSKLVVCSQLVVSIRIAFNYRENNLQNDKHVKGLYQIKRFLAPAYLRDYFFGGMTMTGRSESINAFIKRFISSHTSLMDFFKQALISFFEFFLLTSSL